MNQPDFFGVVVRTIGLLAFLQGAHLALYAVLASTRVITSLRKGYTARDYIVSAVVHLLGGLLLIFWAEGIVKTIYP